MLNKEIENKEELLRKISKEQYGDEWFIEKTILSSKRQQEKTYTFFRDDKQTDLLKKYNWCQRPCSSNMSLDRFVENGEVEGYMSESLAEEFNLVQVDLNEFIHKFVKPIIKENLSLKADNQKLIEKLEADIEIVKKENNPYIKYKKESRMYLMNIEKIKVEEEILEILKGERE